MTAPHPIYACTPLDHPELRRAYLDAARRLIVLDYDGTLVPFFAHPRCATPPLAVLRTLRRIAGDRRNTVMVISGRTARDLDRFLGIIPRLWLAAEHGALVRPPASDAWEAAFPRPDAEWMSRARHEMERFGARVAGSFIEEKEFSTVWHYRTADPRSSSRLASGLAAALMDLLAGTGLQVVQGQKIVEVKAAAIHKGAIVPKMRHAASLPDFQCAMGDDRTDEDLFAAFSEGAWTVHVGRGHTVARFSVADPAEVLAMLEQLA